MSFGASELADTMVAALIYAEQSGVVAVSTAGNCGYDDYQDQHCTSSNALNYPGGYDATVLSVAAYTEDHERERHSSVNASVDLAAPGDDIRSTCLMPDEPICTLSGTSMAAPYVSATAALLRARHADAPPAAIREALTRTTRPVKGRPAGVHADDFGTGLLDPVAAAAYLDQHPGRTIPSSSGSVGATGPDTVVAGYRTASSTIELATAGGTRIPVAGLEPSQIVPRAAFSRDGAWFAAADGEHLTVVHVDSRRQETVACTCSGVAFNDKGQLLTTDHDVLAVHEPATTSRLRGVRIRNTSGTGGPFTFLSVEGAHGDVTVIGAQFASAGHGAFGVRPDGSTFLIGRGPDPGVANIVLSDDGRWVAWTDRGVCLAPSQLGVVDLTHSGGAAYVTGPLADGEALQIRFDGNTLMAGWAPMQHSGGGCGYPPWPPAQWQAQRPPMGTGTYLTPAKGQWTQANDPRGVVRRMQSGELLYTRPMSTPGRYELWFGPAPGGAAPVHLRSDVIEVVARPL
jgi:Subtilase family